MPSADKDMIPAPPELGLLSLALRCPFPSSSPSLCSSAFTGNQFLARNSSPTWPTVLAAPTMRLSLRSRGRTISDVASLMLQLVSLTLTQHSHNMILPHPPAPLALLTQQQQSPQFK